jgi:hypothetical protein
MQNNLTGWRAFIAALLLFAGTAIGHYFPAPGPTPAPNPTDVIVVPPQPIPSPNTTVVPVVPPAPVPVVPVNPTPVIPPVPVNPPAPVPIPVTDLASLIAAIDQEFTQSETQKNGALTLLTKLQTLLQGVETKHGLLPAPAPVPIPINPTPVNPVNPTPVVPPTPNVVTPTGFRVIIVFDPMANNTRDQLNTIYSTSIRDYLNSHCVKGADGRPEWRMWAPTLEVGTKESPTMVALWNATKSQMGPLLVGTSPQLVISVNGAAKVYPLPNTETDTLNFLKQQGGQ